MTPVLWIAAFFAAAAAYAYLIHGVKVSLRRQLPRDVARSGCACLTFDDGPHPELTPIVLDLLARHQVRATFFVVGQRAEQYPELIARLVREGHEVGEHGYSHLHAWFTSPVRLARDLWRCARVTRALGLEQKPVLFRPPHGKLSLMTWLYVILCARHLAFWSVDPRDYAQTEGAETARQVKAQMAPGAVVLLHDGNPVKNEATQQFVTAEALELILRDAAGGNVRLAPLGEALGIRRTS